MSGLILASPALTQFPFPVVFARRRKLGESACTVVRKLFCHARQIFPKERVRARNEFSKTRGHRRPKHSQLRTMKWIQLAYCILFVNAVVAAIMAIVIRLTTRTGTEG